MTALELAGVGRGPLSGIDLQLDAGQSGWLRGPSASGKTLALYLASGLATPAAGSVRVAGLPPEPGRVAMLFQNPDYQLLAATVGEDVRLNAASEQAAAAALATTDCQALAGTDIGALTPGQRRRAALAGVLATEADLILLDAPFAGLQAEEAAHLWQRVRAYAAERRMAILAAGDPPPASADPTWEVALWHTPTNGTPGLSSTR